ncbi:transcription elongation factor A protein-like 7 [Ochotona curzoniae]|uniref:transcription elongation factor A protein-like 7 n=1 Tax=Ochotona curzoniae TaxID=130825 RepID=UPI001B350877|nr:transcription elongation factor A protein-like 7 [Ochotona curzoniae]
MEKPSKENEGQPKGSVPQTEEERPYGACEQQRIEGNFRQRLLQSLEDFKEDVDYRHLKHEEVTREVDEMERCLEEIRSLRKKFRALHFNDRHSRDRPYPI